MSISDAKEIGHRRGNEFAKDRVNYDDEFISRVIRSHEEATLITDTNFRGESN